MNFDLTDEQTMIRDLARDFAKEVIRPRGDAAGGACLEVTTAVVGEELFRFGTEEQKRQWLIPIAQGRIIGAFALTEPDSGSDAGALRTTAVRDGNEWVLNGSKQFITNIGVEN